MFTELGVLRKESSNNSLVFQTGGYITISEELYEDSKVSFSFAMPIEKIVLIPKYLNDSNFLFVSLDKDDFLHIGGVIKNKEKIYGDVPVADKIQATNKISVLSYNNQFTVYLNDVEVYKFESATFINGQVRVYGETGESFFSCDIEEPQTYAWLTNGNEVGVEVKNTKYLDSNFMKLSGTQTKKALISQTQSLATGNHVITFVAKGVGACIVKDGSTQTALKTFTINASDYTQFEVSFSAGSAISNAIVEISTNTSLTVGKIQLEKRTNATAYIPNTSTTTAATRNEALLKYPTKEGFDNGSGSMYTKITFYKSLAMANHLVWKTDTAEISLYSKTNTFEFTVGAAKVNVPYSVAANTDIELFAAWNDTTISLYVNGVSATVARSGTLSQKVGSFIFAETNSMNEQFVLHEWAYFPTRLKFDGNIDSYRKQSAMQSLFEGGVSGKNVSWSEIPVAPNDNSPILVQKENGETLQKVSFFDFETGKYQSWNKEQFIYDGKSDFVEVAYNNLNQDFRDISIQTEAGEKIGEPYRIEGKRFYFSLSPYYKVQYKNQPLYATYQVNDSYTIDYNIKAIDGYRIDFSKHDGCKRIVYQEGNRFAESKKLATMVELNPINNQNSEGFLYVTNTVNPTVSFRVTATPDRLLADGFSSSTLVIELLDYQGNFVSHSNLEIKTDKGFVARYISQDAVEAQKRSGQYLYQYYAPYIKSTQVGEIVEDHIWIIDKDNNIGVCYKMLLSPAPAPHRKSIKQEVKTLLSHKTKIIDAILMYEGTQMYEDSELVGILDLNEDGVIDLNEISVLQTNQKDSQLTIILNKLKKWEDVNL